MKWKRAALFLAALAVTTTGYASEGPGAVFQAEPAPVAQEAPVELPFAAAVKQNGKWGAIDASGRAVIPLVYDKVALSLSSDDIRQADLASDDNRANLIEVQSKKLRGFYNRDGKEIVPVSYGTRSFWREGRLAVEGNNRKVGFYTEDGDVLSEPVYDSVSDFQNGMAIVKQDGKYGYLTAAGDEIVPTFKEAHYFEEGAAPVKLDGKWGVIDTDGRWLVEPVYSDAGPSYSEGLLAVKDNENHWGFIDKAGTVVIPLTYKAVQPFFREGYTAVQARNKLWGFVDNQGNMTAEPQFKGVLTPFSEGLAGVKTTDGRAYAKPDGSIAFMADYDQLFPFRNGIAEIREGVVQDVVVQRSGPPISIGIGFGWGHWFAPPPPPPPGGGGGFGISIGFPLWGWDPWYGGYDEVIPAVQVSRGYIDNTGKVLVSPSNDYVYSMGTRGALVLKNSRFGWVDREGNFQAHIVYRQLLPDEESGILLAKNEDKNWGLLSMDDGGALTDFMYDNLQLTGGGFVAYKEDGKWGLLRADGTEITQAVYKSVGKAGEGLVPVKTKDRGWVFLDETGGEAISFGAKKATDITPFKRGLAGVKMDGKWGLIDHSGKFVVRPVYDDMNIL